MKKKIVIVLFIFIAISLAMGGMFSSQKAYAASSHQCWVPYNLKTGG